MTTSETPRPTAPAETNLAAKPYHIEGMPEELQLSKLDKLAGSYEVMITAPGIQKEDGSGPDLDKINATVTELVNEYLESAGFVTENQTDEQRREYEFAFSVVERAMRTNKQDWIGYTTDDGGHDGVSNQVFRELLAHYKPVETAGTDDDPGTGDDDPGTGEDDDDDSDDDDAPEPAHGLTAEQKKEFEALEAKLDALRESWAKESAKRQGRMFSFDNEYRDNLYREYQAAATALAAKHMEVHNDWSDEDKQMIATALVFDEQEKLRNLTTEKLKGTKISKIIQWMNKGSKFTRIAKGVGIGLVAGVAGSFMAGLAGTAAVAGGAVALTRFARGFALGDKDRRGMKSFDQVVDINELDGKSWKDQQAYAEGTFEEGTRHEQKKRTKAGVYGVGAIAVGAAMGGAIHWGAESLSGRNLSAVSWLTDRWNGGNGASKDLSGYGSGRDPYAEWPGRQSGAGWHPDIANGDSKPKLPFVDPTESKLDTSMIVEAGHGYSHELVDFAHQNGQELTSKQAYQLHLALVEHFGKDYIDLDQFNGSDIYVQHGDVRINAPGAAHWEKGVPEFAQQWMSQRGLWHTVPKVA